ncbi:MAG: hypothetical protein MJZ21_03065 [archaeon]|nr:hypothetical protein [archaeon]
METQDIIALVIVYLIIGAALVLSLLAEKKGWNKDATRKIVHIGVGSFIWIWWAFTEYWIMLAFFAIPFEIILILAAIPGNPVSNSKLGELSSDKGHRWGLVFYVATIIIMVVCFNSSECIFGAHWMAATIGIVAMTRGDGFGSVIGKKYGKHKIIHGKSLEGTIGVFVATFISAMVMMMLYSFLFQNPPFGWFVNAQVVEFLPALGYAAVAGILAAVLEAVCNGDYDNLVMPSCIVAVLILLGL